MFFINNADSLNKHQFVISTEITAVYIWIESTLPKGTHEIEMDL